MVEDFQPSPRPHQESIGWLRMERTKRSEEGDALREKIKAWVVSLRPFVVPWMAANCFLGVALAGFELPAWILASVITTSILFAGHLLNNIRDYQKGIDSLEEGSEEKSYTSAQKILPSGALSVGTMFISALGFIGLGTGLLLAFCPVRLDVWLLFSLGLAMTCTYHDFWKPRGFPEISLFLGHGLATTAFAYSLVEPVTLTAVSAGILTGLFAASVSTLDAWKDVETDYAEKVKGLAWTIARTDLPISQFCAGSLVMIYVVQIGMVLMGLLPAMTLMTIIMLPPGHLTSIILEKNFDKGVMLYLLVMWLFAVLMGLGVLFS